jgi:addiction module HigA family antidote
MTINREDLAAIDFSKVATGQRLQPVRPGDILLHDFMEPLGLSANALANALHVPANRITAILAGTRGITADPALRLARYFGTTLQFWMNLQTNYDLHAAQAKVGSRINHMIAQRQTVAA